MIPHMRLLVYLLLILLLFTSCSRLLDLDPPGGQRTDPFSNDTMATKVVLGMLEQLMKTQGLVNGHPARLGGLLGDELIFAARAGPEAEFQLWSFTPQNRFLPAFWSSGYECIATCNLVIDRLPPETRVSDTMRRYLVGEARFMRALCYFYLLNFFDHIPLATGTDVAANAQLPQALPAEVHEQLLLDLREAARLLPVTHPQAIADTLRRTRLERGAAHALLARTHLYLEHYDSAAYYAGLVIESGNYSLPNDLVNTFTYTSKEAIFQLKPVSANTNTAEGSLFLQEPAGKPVYKLTDAVLQSFAPGDQRRVRWTKPADSVPAYLPFKYRIKEATPRREYNLVLRLGEQYLIRAEARARRGDLPGARADLEKLRVRTNSSLPGPLTTANQVLLAIVRERQAELFTEWGHRFFDLKRWFLQQQKDDTLQHYATAQLSKKPGWQAYKLSLPLPHQELQKNGRLKQNTGY